MNFGEWGRRISRGLPGMRAIQDFDEAFREAHGLSGRVADAQQAARGNSDLERELREIAKGVGALQRKGEVSDFKAAVYFWVGLSVGALFGIAGIVVSILLA